MSQMFVQTWKKYLPVIVILIKRSVNGEQILDMNHTDFQRAAGGRKMKFSFELLWLNKGRSIGTSQHNAVARDLLFVLQEEDLTKKLLAGKNLEFFMNGDFRLHIKASTGAEISPP